MKSLVIFVIFINLIHESLQHDKEGSSFLRTSSYDKTATQSSSKEDTATSVVTSYTDEDFEAAKKYASMRFRACCTEMLDNDCADRVCQYGLNADYMRSALISKCHMDNATEVQHFFTCANGYMDNFSCCLSLGIEHHCCYDFSWYHFNYFGFNADDFFNNCTDVLKAISYCPILNY